MTLKNFQLELKMDVRGQVQIFFILNNQNATLIDIREKIEDLGEKLKTHVLKISLGSQAIN